MRRTPTTATLPEVTTAPASADDAATAARLRLSATRLARRLRQQTDTGLTPTQLSALAAIDRHGPLTLGDLAQHERVAPPTITRVVGKLEGDGLVTRQPDHDDRRAALVATTRAGRRLMEGSHNRKEAWLVARIARLDADQRDRLEQALDVLEDLVGGEDA